MNILGWQVWLTLLLAWPGLPGQSVGGPSGIDQPVQIESRSGSRAALLTLPVGVRTPANFVIFVPHVSLSPEEGYPTTYTNLAQALAKQGVASIRYETPAPSPNSSAGHLPAGNQVEDAAAALRFAKERLGAKTENEFVIAYGLAASLGPEVAQKSPSRGIILLAPVVLPIEDVAAAARRRDLERLGRNEEQIHQTLESQNRIFADIRSGKIPKSRFIDGSPASYWLEWMNRNPVEELRKLSIPVLVLRAGSRDDSSDANYEKLEKGLGAGQAEFRTVSNLNGRSEPAGNASGASAEADAQVVTAIANWIKQHVPSPSQMGRPPKK